MLGREGLGTRIGGRGSRGGGGGGGGGGVQVQPVCSTLVTNYYAFVSPSTECDHAGSSITSYVLLVSILDVLPYSIHLPQAV